MQERKPETSSLSNTLVIWAGEKFTGENYLATCNLACLNPKLILLHKFTFLPDELLFDLSTCWKGKTQASQ